MRHSNGSLRIVLFLLASMLAWSVPTPAHAQSEAPPEEAQPADGDLPDQDLPDTDLPDRDLPTGEDL